MLINAIVELPVYLILINRLAMLARINNCE